MLEAFSSEVTQDDWSQADVLGWVYQYYNTDANAELKKLKNKTTGFKYKPDDIPIANQFYTPHWVVRVLTDNTLGRLWLEAQDRLPRLESDPYRLAEARKGVPHAAKEPEAFKTWLLEEPDPLTDQTVDRLCRFLVPLPSQPLPRAKKGPREIKVLDPACGSGHFLLYAFDVLFAMYREAEPDFDPREIPALILAENLFGVDIDLRAAQLAAFMLYLKARATLARIDPEASLEVRGLNIIVADAHVGNGPRKATFLDRYKDAPEVRQLYAKILSDLDHTNVLGSLLKVRTEFESLFGRVREAKKKDADWAPTGQQVLLDVTRQKELIDTFRSLSGRSWTIGELLDDLRAFERESAPSKDVGGAAVRDRPRKERWYWWEVQLSRASPPQARAPRLGDSWSQAARSRGAPPRGDRAPARSRARHQCQAGPARHRGLQPVRYLRTRPRPHRTGDRPSPPVRVRLLGSRVEQQSGRGWPG